MTYVSPPDFFLQLTIEPMKKVNFPSHRNPVWKSANHLKNLAQACAELGMKWGQMGTNVGNCRSTWSLIAIAKIMREIFTQGGQKNTCTRKTWGV